jgi:hypothetical protein
MFRRPGNEVAFHFSRLSPGNSTCLCGQPVDKSGSGYEEISALSRGNRQLRIQPSPDDAPGDSLGTGVRFSPRRARDAFKGRARQPGHSTESVSKKEWKLP